MGRRNKHTIDYGADPANNGVTYTGFVGDEDANVLNGTLVGVVEADKDNVSFTLNSGTATTAQERRS